MKTFILIILIVYLMIAAGTADAGDWTAGYARVDDLTTATRSFVPMDHNKWTWEDIALQTTFLAALAVDRAQTQEGQIRNLEEVGWAHYFIGSTPSSGQINRYFASCAILHTTIAWWIPKEIEIKKLKFYPRELWQSTWIGIEINTIHTNISAGISTRF